jgi:hypothetical protein
MQLKGRDLLLPSPLPKSRTQKVIFLDPSYDILQKELFAPTRFVEEFSCCPASICNSNQFETLLYPNSTDKSMGV